MNEQELIAGCLRNDRNTQKALYDKYKKRMYTLAYRITNNFEDADDVLQDGFVKVFTNLKSFKGNAKLDTWIHTIMARTAISKIRSKIHFINLEEIQEETAIDWGSQIDIGYLEQAISALSDSHRCIFTLYEIDGFKHREIADMLNISESSSKTQLHRAKVMLKEMLNNMND